MLSVRRNELINQASAILARAERERRDLTKIESRQVDEIHSEIARLDSQSDPNRTPIGGAASMNGPVASYNATDEYRSNGAFKTFGEQLRSVITAAIEGNQVDNRLHQLNAEYRAIDGMSESVVVDGGFVVQRDFQNQLLRSVFETGVLASRVTVIPISGNSNGLNLNVVDESSRVNGSRFGAIDSFWIGEGGAITSSKLKTRRMELSLHKLVGLTFLTDELIEDASALETVVRESFRQEFAFRLDDAILRGTGAGQPLGILNSGAVVSIAKETGQAANSLVYENLVKMLARLPGSSQNRAVWLAHSSVIPQLYSLSLAVGTGGVPVYLPANQAAGKPFTTLFGLPIFYIEQAETVGTTGDIMLVDLAEYVAIVKGGMKSASSIHLKFDTAQTALRFILRVDAQPLWSKSLTPFRGTDSISPYIKLDTRA